MNSKFLMYAYDIKTNKPCKKILIDYDYSYKNKLLS